MPLIGNAHQVRPDTLHLTAEKWARQYGPLYRFDIGKRKIIVVGNVETLNSLLRDRPDGFRRWREILQITEEVGKVGVFAAEGEDWRRTRRLAVTALNSNHLQRYFEIVSTCTEHLYGRLSAAAESGQGFEIGQALSAFTVDVTSALAFGHDLNTLERGDDALQGHLHHVFHMTNRRLFFSFPYWRYFKLPVDRQLDRSMEEIEKAITGFMEETRRRIAERPELREKPENFLESMIAAQETEGTFSDEEIMGNVFTLLLAGEDTTSHSMAWTIWSLARRPAIQAKWAEEAHEVLGEQPYATEYETVEGFRYGEGVLRESMRLTPVAPISGLEPLADTEIEGVHVPAGTRLFLLHRYAGLQSTVRSEEFKPERWLEEEEELPVPDQKSFLTFGAGPRFCPGRNLAFLEAKTALGMIARNSRSSSIQRRRRSPSCSASRWARRGCACVCASGRPRSPHRYRFGACDSRSGKRWATTT